MIRFRVLSVLENGVVSEIVLGRGLCCHREQLSQDTELVGKKQSLLRTLMITDRSLKFLKPKGALGRTFCSFGVKRVFDLRKYCKN